MTAIIPARGGSKGLPGKNIRPLLGKPLIAHSIECALGARSIDRVVVSTDSPEIADIALRFGGEVPCLRPAELATDGASAVDAYIYTVDRLSRSLGEDITSFAVLLPTAPLRTSDDVDNAIELFFRKNADSVVSYTPEAHPIHWHKYLDADGSLVDIFGDTLANRQDLRTSYYPNGAVYVFKSSLIRERKYYSGRSYAYVMPRCRSIDIDTLEDFELAEFLMRRQGHDPAAKPASLHDGGALP